MMCRLSPTSEPTAVDTPSASAPLRRRVLFLATLAIHAGDVRLGVRAISRRPALPASERPGVSDSTHARRGDRPDVDHPLAQLRPRAPARRGPGSCPRVGCKLAIDRLGQRDDVVVDRDLRQAQATVRGVASEADLDLTFPPIRDSAGQRYRLRAMVPIVVDGTLALAANRDNTYLARVVVRQRAEGTRRSRVRRLQLDSHERRVVARGDRRAPMAVLLAGDVLGSDRAVLRDGFAAGGSGRRGDRGAGTIAGRVRPSRRCDPTVGVVCSGRPLCVPSSERPVLERRNLRHRHAQRKLGTPNAFTSVSCRST